jgi:hypothetical protein
MTYPGYIDLATGKTLICEPGGTYDLLPETVPTDGRFTVSTDREAIPEKEEEASVTEDSPAEPDDDVLVS